MLWIRVRCARLVRTTNRKIFDTMCVVCELCACCLISLMLKCIHTVQYSTVKSVKGTISTKVSYECVCALTVRVLHDAVAFSIPFSPIYLLPFLQNNITSFIFAFRRIQSIIHVNIILCLRRSYKDTDTHADTDSMKIQAKFRMTVKLLRGKMLRYI